MNLFTFVTLCAFLSTATSQYYYVSQPAVYHFQQPTTYNAFAPFSTYHVNPHFHQFRGVPAQHSHFQQFRTVPVPQPPPAPQPPSAPVHRTALAQNDEMDYRGFAYHTRTDNGATSHVLFVTGPQAQQVNSRVFNNFNARAFGQNNEVNQARTFASEMIDPVQKQEEKQNVLPKNIQDLYTPPAMRKVENNDPYQVFQSFFQGTQGPASRLINFYSRNTDLFAQPAPGYPANVVPLPYNTNGLNPSVLQTQNNTESNNDNEEKKSDIEVAAESIITNTQFRLNDFDDQFESKKTQSTSTPTTATSLTSTTTEYLESSSISALESSTSTFEEVTISSTKASEDLSSSSARSVEDGNFLVQRFGNPDSSKDMPDSESSTSENVSMSVKLTSSEPIPSSSESAVLTSTIVTTEETDTDDKITTINTILDSTTEKSLSTNEEVNTSEEMTTTRDTIESDADSTTNPLAEVVEMESKTSDLRTEEDSNENISTTENISITTDAMMSTTSQ